MGNFLSGVQTRLTTNCGVWCAASPFTSTCSRLHCVAILRLKEDYYAR
jgi:hypothetical protein